MSQVVNNKIADDVQDQETTILENLDQLQYLLECAKVWCTKGISVKEAHKQINELKIKFAVTEG